MSDWAVPLVAGVGSTFFRLHPLCPGSCPKGGTGRWLPQETAELEGGHWEQGDGGLFAPPFCLPICGLGVPGVLRTILAGCINCLLAAMFRHPDWSFCFMGGRPVDPLCAFPSPWSGFPHLAGLPFVHDCMWSVCARPSGLALADIQGSGPCLSCLLSMLHGARSGRFGCRGPGVCYSQQGSSPCPGALGS